MVSVVVVMARGAPTTTVRDWVWVCGVGLESWAATVKVKVPGDVGVPEITPAVGCMARPGGSEPAAKLQVYGGVPPLATMVARYATPSDPAGKALVEMFTTVTTVRLSCACAEAGPPAAADESTTCTAKEKVPETVGIPVIVPELLNVKPVGKVPLATLQVRVPTPPVASRLAR